MTLKTKSCCSDVLVPGRQISEKLQAEQDRGLKTVVSRMLDISKDFPTIFFKIDPKGEPSMQKWKRQCFSANHIFLPEYEFYIFSAFIWDIKHVWSSFFFNFDFFHWIWTIIVPNGNFLKFLKTFKKRSYKYLKYHYQEKIARLWHPPMSNKR